jgi:hypothetical protein
VTRRAPTRTAPGAPQQKVTQEVVTERGKQAAANLRLA